MMYFYLLLAFVIILLVIFVALGTGFFMYIGAMSIKKDWPNMSMKKKTLLFIPAIMVYLYDVFILNFIIGTIYFREAPQELTLSEKLDRMANSGDGWAARQANDFCKEFLNQYDPSGFHCGKRG